MILLVACRCKRQIDLLRRHAAAIIPDADQSDAAALDFDLDASGTRIEAVLDQFLDHGSRAFNHLASSDLVDELVREDPNRHERESMPDSASFAQVPGTPLPAESPGACDVRASAKRVPAGGLSAK